jgi:hypothetical protein
MEPTNPDAAAQSGSFLPNIIKSLALTLSLLISAPVFGATGVADDFEDGVLNSTVWDTSLPFGSSAVVETGGLLSLTARGTLRTLADLNDAVEVRGSFRINNSLDNLKVALRTDLSTHSQYAEVTALIVEFNGSGGAGLGPSPSDQPWLASGTFPNPVGQFHEFLIRDSGTIIEVFLDGSEQPLLSATSTFRTGNRIAFYNREFSGLKTDLDFIEISELPAPTVSITKQPESVEVMLGGDATFEVEATGVGTLLYQWRFEGARIIGATSPTLTITDVTELDVGSYKVQITDDNGSIESDPAELTLLVDSDGDGLSDRYERGYGRYFLIPAQMTWSEAKADAESRGGRLATIISQQEWDAILEVITANGQTFQGTSTAIGGTDAEQEGVWRWITGESWGFTRWHQNGIEPSNSGGIEHALGITSYAGFPWNDIALDSPIDHYLLEFGYFTDPNNADTDGDGIDDGVEVAYGSIPTLASSVPVAKFLTTPISQVVTNGAEVTFTVEVTGWEPIDLQWFHNGEPIEGETSASLVLTGVDREQVGLYTVAATNPAGTVFSAAAQLVVTPLTSLQLLPDGFIFIRIEDIRPGPWQVERSTNLEHWESIGTATFNNGVSALLDAAPPGVGHRFYRAVSP